MKAVIFALEGQGELCRDIDNLLHRHFYERIQVEQRICKTDDRGSIGNSGLELYLDLLKASTVRIGDFTLRVEQEPWKWGYIGDKERDHFLQLLFNRRRYVFPGVAIMDRIVMVPQEVDKAFDVSEKFLVYV